MMRRFRGVLKERGLTDQQWRILRALAEHGAMTATALADECCMPGPSITGVLDRMEQGGLVSRSRSAADQRRMDIVLTPQGAALVEAALPDIERVYAELEHTVGAARLAALARELEDLLVALDDAQVEETGEVPS
ncbi:MAG: homoprotocatechuate degradation operon regulator HpaR [Betaproteobacteria bacterium]|nr:homoprotocatechuate degradation operon regulator HpaR [Betaproteobacteria bacterium]